MFDLSFGEITIIAVIGLLVIGPKELPVVARYIRDILRSIRETTHSIRSQVNEALDEDELRAEWQESIRLIEGDDGKMYEAFDLSDILPPQEQGRRKEQQGDDGSQEGER